MKGTQKKSEIFPSPLDLKKVPDHDWSGIPSDWYEYDGHWFPPDVQIIKRVEHRMETTLQFHYRCNVCGAAYLLRDTNLPAPQAPPASKTPAPAPNPLPPYKGVW